MPLQNRVNPFGDLIAVPDRGLFTGNRGILHTADKRIVHYNVGRRWIVCQLEFRGWRREVMEPRRWTQLFFLDEATALSAGHRPCATCRRAEYRRFRRCWAAARGGPLPPADALDLVLHRERLAGSRTKATYHASIEALPDGVMIAIEREPWLLWRSALLRWTPAGYDMTRPRPTGEVEVLTPPSIVRTIAAGYVPVVHPSANQEFAFS